MSGHDKADLIAGFIAFAPCLLFIIAVVVALVVA